MKILNKRATAFTIILTATITLSIFAFPLSNAHTPPYQIKTYAKVTVFPDPIQVGQSALLYAFLGNAPPPGSAIVNTYRFHNYTIIITDPNGKVTTLFYDTVQDTTGVQGYRFIPTVVGTWHVTFNYGGQTHTTPGVDQPVGSANLNDTYLPSSATTTLTVQEEPIVAFPNSYPLPTEYWTRSIYEENPYWFSISSNWLGTGAAVNPASGVGTISGIPTGGGNLQRYPGDAIGSTTSHVMWAKGWQTGGVVGGDSLPIEGNSYFSGSAYIQRMVNPIIVNGKLIYTQNVGWGSEGSTAGPTSYGPTVAQDLRTGEIIWSRTDVPALSFAYIYDVETPNQHGVAQPVLFTSNFARAFDADSGQPLYNVSGVPTGAIGMGPNGEQLRYVSINRGNTSRPDYYLGEWNSTKLWVWTGLGPALYNSTQPYTNVPYSSNGTNTAWSNVNGVVNGGGTFTVQGNVFNSTERDNRYDWNVSLPFANTMPGGFTMLNAIPGEVLLCRNGSYPSLTGQINLDGSLVNANYTYFAINLNASKGTLGSVRWWATYNVPQDRTIVYGGLDPQTGIFFEDNKETANFNAYSLADGSKLWGPNKPEAAMDYFGNPAYPYVTSQPAYGNIYSLQYGGVLYCFDQKTGDLKWTYGNGGVPGNDTNSGLQVPGYYPAFINAVGNGIIYTVTTEHTIETPIYKGAMARAINATDGTEIWTLNAYTSEFFAISYGIADGYNAFFNDLDARVYVVGKGPSRTTVTAPDIAVAFRTPIVIKGTVTDISAGTQQNEQAARFPNGVPVVADVSMTEWMGYVYQQKPKPTNAIGVDVVLTVLDSNNNTYTIGTAKTDASGTFSFVYTPEISGKFVVTATFEGTNGYWPSSAENSFSVMEAPAPTPEEPQPPPSMTDTYIMYAAMAIIVAVAVVGAIILLVLRKRP